MPVHVGDPGDPRLADYRALKDPARPAREAASGVFVVEGRLAVGELLRSPYEMLSLLVNDHQLDAAADLVATAEAAGATVYASSRAVVEATVGFDLHRGVVAVARRPGAADPQAVVAGALARARDAGGRAVLAVLEGLNDHENLGAIFRNAAAFGVGGVLLDPSCADPLYRRSVRVSLGHVLRVPFARLDDWPGDLTRLVEDSGAVLGALVPEHSAGAADPARRAGPLAEWAGRLPGAVPVAVLLGAEGPGLSAGAIAAAHDVVCVPMAPGVDSLNVATAAALAFYELARQAPAPGRA